MLRLLRQPFEPLWALNVMLVDDDMLHRRLAGIMLRKLGCSSLLLEDGNEVPRALAESDRPFDVILLDVHMAHSDGRDVCSRLIEEHGYQGPIVACTGVCVCVWVYCWRTAPLCLCSLAPSALCKQQCFDTISQHLQGGSANVLGCGLCWSLGQTVRCERLAQCAGNAQPTQ